MAQEKNSEDCKVIFNIPLANYKVTPGQRYPHTYRSGFRFYVDSLMLPEILDAGDLVKVSIFDAVHFYSDRVYKDGIKKLNKLQVDEPLEEMPFSKMFKIMFEDPEFVSEIKYEALKPTRDTVGFLLTLIKAKIIKMTRGTRIPPSVRFTGRDFYGN